MVDINYQCWTIFIYIPKTILKLNPGRNYVAFRNPHKVPMSPSLARIQAVMFEFDDFKSHSSKDIQTFSRPPLRLMWDGIANESWIVYTFSADRITWLICISLSHLSMGYVVPSVPCVTTLAFCHCMDQWAILLWLGCLEVVLWYVLGCISMELLSRGSGDHLKGDWNEIPTREWPLSIQMDKVLFVINTWLRLKRWYFTFIVNKYEYIFYKKYLWIKKWTFKTKLGTKAKYLSNFQKYP